MTAAPCKICKRPTSAKSGTCDRHRWAHGRVDNQPKEKENDLSRTRHRSDRPSERH
jgi:hypothetical protein